MQLIPNAFVPEIEKRTERIRKLMKADNTDALLIGANTNIYYTSGRFFRGFVYISLDKDPLWFVIKPNDIKPSDNIRYIRKPEDIPAILEQLNYSVPSAIGLEENDLSYAEIIRLKALFPAAIMKNASIIMKKSRMVKTDWELNEMRKDGQHHIKVYGEIKDCYRPGITDLELQIEIERRLRLEGSLGVSRVAGNLMEINLGSVISGSNADSSGPYEFTMTGEGAHPSLPVGANGSEILKGQTVMIDMNGAFNGYQTDMTRVWRVDEIPSLALRAHECSIDILRCLEMFAKPGVPVKDLYEMALGIVEAEGLSDYFMGHKNKVSFIGHGVGIELNELPVINAKSKDILEENMTIAIEPKFVIPEVGAVGVENTYIVSYKGLVNITPFPEEIQAL